MVYYCCYSSDLIGEIFSLFLKFLIVLIQTFAKDSLKKIRKLRKVTVSYCNELLYGNNIFRNSLLISFKWSYKVASTQIKNQSTHLSHSIKNNDILNGPCFSYDSLCISLCPFLLCFFPDDVLERLKMCHLHVAITSSGMLSSMTRIQ